VLCATFAQLANKRVCSYLEIRNYVEFFDISDNRDFVDIGPGRLPESNMPGQIAP